MNPRFEEDPDKKSEHISSRAPARLDDERAGRCYVQCIRSEEKRKASLTPSASGNPAREMPPVPHVGGTPGLHGQPFVVATLNGSMPRSHYVLGKSVHLPTTNERLRRVGPAPSFRSFQTITLNRPDLDGSSTPVCTVTAMTPVDGKLWMVSIHPEAGFRSSASPFHARNGLTDIVTADRRSGYRW